MPELGFEDQSQQSSGFRARDVSPDSLIFTVESNFSLFSSASGSVDRSSFASDVHDHHSLVSEVSQNLARHDLRETSSGPDSDPNKSTVNRNSRLSRKVEKAKGSLHLTLRSGGLLIKKEATTPLHKISNFSGSLFHSRLTLFLQLYTVHKEDSDAEKGGKNETLDSARNSSSESLKECQNQRPRSEALFKKPDRRRPASLDLNSHITNATISSPRFGVMKKNSVMTRRTGMLPSPGTPNYHHNSVGIQKGWSSERVPLGNKADRRHVSAVLLPFNNGRTLPSKWEDAERWIFSPVSGDGVVKPLYQQPQRRPKAKSGPLGPPENTYYSLYSPTVPMFGGGNVGNLMAGSPFSTGVIAADGLSICCSAGRGGAGTFPPHMDPFMARSVSVHGCSEMPSQSSLAGPQDEKLDGDKDAVTNISHAVSRKDMATQMSPECRPHSSPRRRPPFSTSTPSVLPIVELEGGPSSKLDVRDVQVDERVTVTRWSKKHRARFPGKGSENIDDWKKKAVDVRCSAWEVSEAAKSISKMKREEANIIAWENLQKAKAEAAIRKLEMKLEKKRSSSMDKIMNKLRSAQKKAQQMRSSVLPNQSHQVARTSRKVISFHRTCHISSLSGCFVCPAF